MRCGHYCGFAAANSLLLKLQTRFEDGFYGEVDARIRFTTAKSVLKDVEGLVQCIDSGYERKLAFDATAPLEFTFDWFPPPKKEWFTAKLKLETLPSTLRACYGWDFMIKSQTRRSFIGRNEEKLIATGIYVKSWSPGAVRHTAAGSSDQCEVWPSGESGDLESDVDEDIDEMEDCSMCH